MNLSLSYLYIYIWGGGGGAEKQDDFIESTSFYKLA